MSSSFNQSHKRLQTLSTRIPLYCGSEDGGCEVYPHTLCNAQDRYHISYPLSYQFGVIFPCLDLLSQTEQQKDLLRTHRNVCDANTVEYENILQKHLVSADFAKEEVTEFTHQELEKASFSTSRRDRLLNTE
ncbi:uncharacterized [Tachysurus ichikawai]